jgi:hypothetical protein
LKTTEKLLIGATAVVFAAAAAVAVAKPGNLGDEGAAPESTTTTVGESGAAIVLGRLGRKRQV